MYDVLLYITFAAGLVPLILYLLFKVRKDIDEEINAVLPYIGLIAVGSIYEPVVTLAFGVNSTYWFRAYDILEFASLYYFFTRLVPFKRYRGLFLCCLLVFIAGVIGVGVTDISQFFLESMYAPLIFSFVVLFSTVWIWELFGRADVLWLLKSPAFYFVSGFVFYYSATFFFFLFGEVIYESGTYDYKDYWLLNIIAALLLRTLLIIGIWNGRNT